MNINIENIPCQTVKKRVDYIDAMRGFTMIIVVYCHICTYVLHCDSYIDSIFIRFRMPLFFFISGLMVYSSKPVSVWIKRKLKNRLLNQFLPTFCSGSLFALFISYDLKYALFDSNKLGYWFTIVLFEMFLIYLICAALTERFSRKIKLVSYTLVIIVSCMLFMFFRRMNLIYSNISNLFSVPQFLFYVSYFFLGIICKMYMETFLKIVKNKYFNALIFSYFIVSIYLDCQNVALKFLTSVAGIYVVYRTFQFNKEYFSNQNKVSKGLSFVGKNTLQVYFLHYFIIQGLHIDNTLILHAISESWLFELLFCFTISIFVVVLSLMCDRFLKSFKIIHTLMFGPELKK